MVDSSTGWVVGEKEFIMRTTDGGNHWRTQTPARPGDLWAVSSIDRQHAFAGGAVFMSTTNGGATWVRTATPGNYTITDLSFIDAQRGWAATQSNKVFRTINGGVNWTQQEVPTQTERLYAIDFVDSNYGWCTSAGIIYATTNGGFRWVVQTIRAVQLIDFVDRNYGWAAGPRLILKTTDGGTHWDSSYVSMDALLSGLQFVNRDTGWAVGERGRIIATTNGGATWIVQRAGRLGDPNLLSVDAISSRLVWASGASGEILHTTNGGGITAVDATAMVIPARFELEQNYPNPFNPTTKIRFGIPTSGFVSLRVYDLLGREVATLVEEHMQPGRFETRFDASRAASGIYLYRLVSNGNTAVRKMLLLR
jgi:photosystem II stability/assembly factor-like uncharacterized protein